MSIYLNFSCFTRHAKGLFHQHSIMQPSSATANQSVADCRWHCIIQYHEYGNMQRDVKDSRYLKVVFKKKQQGERGTSDSWHLGYTVFVYLHNSHHTIWDDVDTEGGRSWGKKLFFSPTHATVQRNRVPCGLVTAFLGCGTTRTLGLHSLWKPILTAGLVNLESQNTFECWWF